MKSAAIRKLNVNGSTSASKGQIPPLEEFYKQIPEDQNLLRPEKQLPQLHQNHEESNANPTQGESNPDNTKSGAAVVTNTENGKMVADQNGLNDGADEQMLNGAEDNDKLADKREEVKFIKGGDHQNGDAKIDIGGVNGKAFTGMTKEELMKYANDPFWVRLRWIFFIGFWAIWAAMLICAILIIVDAPKCAAPEPLQWYKRGLLAKFDAFEASASNIESAKRVEASGVIYELPPALTYLVREPAVEEKIKDIVANYKKLDINVILDVTPNYVPRNSTLLNEALQDKSKRSAFIWKEDSKEPSNWRSLQNGSAWDQIKPGSYLLSQFGVGQYDLQMNDSLVKSEFESVLKYLLSLGVKGFRLKNTKFFLLTDNTPDEGPASEGNFVHNEYGFWTHTHSTFQEGLGDLLYEFKMFVKNISADAFLSVADDILRPDVYRTKNGEWGIDMPIYGPLVHSLSASSSGRKLQGEFENIINAVGNDTWLQWNFAEPLSDVNNTTDPTAIALFVSLLPGVPVVGMTNSSLFKEMQEHVFTEIKQLRLSPSYMHGEYHVYDTEGLFAYTRQRIKSGNPGYFVAFNPSNNTVKGGFNHTSLPDKMSVYALSDNYNISNVVVKSKVQTDSLEISPGATIILTYVPVKSG
ncbi:4F2 cell-surface antigen heavy chain isoform X1 [Rhagoletis pomonella]|uniref:4F2 cell-surface antigen heavy chain isoform X1 n=1 Tax=Rhagoletis pomonella TaxID=28610 RepID=UPI0017821E79|nr:4F2 cell-surface antigen heavy chain isoform X1 [Rhagoletis pomonella]